MYWRPSPVPRQPSYRGALSPMIANRPVPNERWWWMQHGIHSAIGQTPPLCIAETCRGVNETLLARHSTRELYILNHWAMWKLYFLLVWPKCCISRGCNPVSMLQHCVELKLGLDPNYKGHVFPNKGPWDKFAPILMIVENDVLISLNPIGRPTLHCECAF